MLRFNIAFEMFSDFKLIFLLSTSKRARLFDVIDIPRDIFKQPTRRNLSINEILENIVFSFFRICLHYLEIFDGKRWNIRLEENNDLTDIASMKSRRFDAHVNRNPQREKSIFPRLHEDDFRPLEKRKLRPKEWQFVPVQITRYCLSRRCEKILYGQQITFFPRRNLQGELNFLCHR